MDTYKIGQTFRDSYPPEAAIWCNKNNLLIVELKTSENYREFQIQELPAPSLEEVKDIKANELKKHRDTEEESPIEYKDKLWDFDSKARDRMNAAIVALEVNGIPSISWTAYDNTSTELTVLDLKTIISLAALRGNELHIKYRTLADSVLASTTIEEINSITW